ncbi:hes family bHLH transcription factor 5 [Rhinolophus ferrumequinum]|uniref:Hes family bHLH transcription factor 5 n=1 Tax=Rhinolophus ferrumequinum TaxID=59479 RepID=A0A7J7X5S0_RHIFE|nr:hes family bHLH transcription factor 5 [Rhinolophus ferrumequinum]
MAPSTVAVELLSPKEKNRLRKPVVEKMRRDRINAASDTQMKLLYHFQRPPAPPGAPTKEPKAPAPVPTPAKANTAARQPPCGLWRPW